MIALARGETINAIWFVFAAVCTYFIGYRFYATYIEKNITLIGAGAGKTIIDGKAVEIVDVSELVAPEGSEKAVADDDGVDVMVVEGSEFFRALFAPLLQNAGYRIAVLPSMAAARAAMTRQNPAVIVLDLDQPGEEAFGLVRELTEIDNPPPVIGLVSRASPKLIEKGIKALPTIGDGRQSGTSESPSILNASPEAAIGGNLAILKTGDRVRLDLPNRRLDVLIDHDEIAQRHAEWERHPPKLPPSQTPWQEIYRSMVGQLSTGACLEPAVLHLKIVETYGSPRRNH